MKVKELIEALKSYPENLEVLTWDCECGYTHINKATLVTVVDKNPNNNTTVNKFDVDDNSVNVGQQFVGLTF